MTEEAVCTSFALGWHMAELFSSTRAESAAVPIATELPGLGALSVRHRFELGLDQLDRAVAQLSDWLGPDAVHLPNSTALRPVLAGSDVNQSEFRRSVLQLHLELVTTLTAADFRCGKAYGLGRSLCDMTVYSQTAPEMERHLGRTQVREIYGWLDDLKSSLPDHAARAVSDSLISWVDWVARNPPSSLEPDELERAAGALRAQGLRWRALLSGEKQALDSLVTDDYLVIARRSLARSSGLTGQIAASLVLPLVLAIALVVIGLVLVFAYNSWARIVTGFGLTALGVGVLLRAGGPVIGHVSRHIEDPIWNAECDRVIGERITEAQLEALPARGSHQRGERLHVPHPHQVEREPAHRDRRERASEQPRRVGRTMGGQAADRAAADWKQPRQATGTTPTTRSAINPGDLYDVEADRGGTSPIGSSDGSHREFTLREWPRGDGAR